MEVQIKKTVKSGNSSAVILPRSWLNKEVRVEILEKTEDTILSEVMEIIKNYVSLKNIIGVYLVGSYSREEQDKNSDIDILVITDDSDKPVIKHGIYNILIISSKLLKQKLERDLFPIGQMIREAKTLLNSNYLDSIEVRVTRENVRWYLETTEEKLALIKKILNKLSDKKNISDKIAYTLVLRIRTLHIIKKLIENKKYSKEEFIKLIEKISKSKKPYERYLAVKNNLPDKNETNKNEIVLLSRYLEELLKEIRKLI